VESESEESREGEDEEVIYEIDEISPEGNLNGAGTVRRRYKLWEKIEFSSERKRMSAIFELLDEPKYVINNDQKDS